MSRLLGLGSRLPRSVRRALKHLPGASAMRSTMAGNPAFRPHAEGSLRPVVYLPTWVEWDVMRQRPQYILSAFAAAGHEVFFVDPRARRERTVDGVTIVRSLAGVPRNDAIVYTHFAPLRTMLDKFEDPVVVYDILDDLSIYEDDEVGLPAERTVAHHHPELVERADVVMVSNEILFERHQSERDDLLLVRNGVDVARFAAPTDPAPDVPDTGPIVGYHGAIAQWFSFDLLEAVATMEPGWQFVLVGPIAPQVATRADTLALASNVHLLGERHPDLMPSYVQAFDAGAVWFEVNHMTRGVSPLKVYEYLAARTPVVSTPLPSCVAEPAVATAGSAETFRNELARAFDLPANAAWRADAERTADEAAWSHRLAPVLDRLASRGMVRVR